MRDWIISITAGILGLLVGGALVFYLYPLVSVSHIQSSFLDEDIPKPGPTLEQTSVPGKTLDVPIVVYHIVRPSYPSDTPAIKKFAVTPQVFEQELAYLQQQGYHVLPFSSVEQYFSSSSVSLPSHSLILTFDDAWEDQYVYAFPLLEKYHDTATFFVPSNFPDHKGFISWDQLRTMVTAGMSVESHSESHPYLASLSSTTTLWGEINGSKIKLGEELGVTPTIFAYPFGQYTPQIVAMVKTAGYRAARADYFSIHNSAVHQYDLGVVNAPTTLSDFETLFPPLR